MKKLSSFLLMIFFCGLSLILLYHVFSAPNSVAALIYVLGFVITSRIGTSFIDRSFS